MQIELPSLGGGTLTHTFGG